MTKKYTPYAVQEVSTTVGTADMVLAGTKDGHRAFGSACENNSTFTYRIKHDAADEWEIGVGNYVQAGNTLTRALVESGSNGLNLVNFSSGSKTVSIVTDNETANLVGTGRYDPVIENESDLPDVADASTLAAGRRANATSNRSVAVGDDSSCASAAEDAVAIGTGAQCNSADDSIAIGNRASCNPAGTLSPFDAVAIGHKATVYARGMHTFSAGGMVSTDITRLSLQTTGTTPTPMDIDADGFTTGQYIQPTQDARPKTVAFEVHAVGYNSTDQGAFYQVHRVLGFWNGSNFVETGTSQSETKIESANMVGVDVSVFITAGDLEVVVTGLASKTIEWGATVFSTTIWHSGVPGSGVA